MDPIAQDAETITDHLNSIRALLRQGEQAKIGSIGLPAQQVALLRELSFLDGQPLKELSQRLGLAHSTVSGIVDRLEKKDLVERRPDPEDRRFTRIHLTNAVQQYLNNELRSKRASRLTAVLENTQPEERADILKGLALLRRLLEKE
jgi:MarR family transcriptional regulator, organic hydroperoxide resistance regulator